MKRIDELFDDFDLKDNIDINESKIDDIELKRIKVLTLEKLDIKPNKKSLNKRIMIPLVAIISLLLLTMVVVSANNNIESIFGGLFSDGYKYIENCSEIVDVYDISENLKLSIDGIIGDKNTCYMKLTMERLDGKVFDCSYAMFDNIRYQMLSSGGFSCYMVDDNILDNKISFIFELSLSKGLRNKNIELNFNDLVLETIDKNIVFDPFEFLSANTELINQNNIINNNISDKSEELKNDDLSQEERDKLEADIEFTQNTIGRGNLNLYIIEKNEALKVDNIGFVNDKLNIRVYVEDNEKNSINGMTFTHKETNEELFPFVTTEVLDNKTYETYIFDIKDMEKLKEYTFTCYSVKLTEKLNGSWNLRIKPNYKPTIKEMKVNKSLELDGKSYRINDIKLSPISIVIDINRSIISKIESPKNYDFKDIKVLLKNGSYVNLRSANISSNLTKIKIIEQFESPIDIKEVDEIIIEGYSVKVK